MRDYKRVEKYFESTLGSNKIKQLRKFFCTTHKLQLPTNICAISWYNNVRSVFPRRDGALRIVLQKRNLQRAAFLTKRSRIYFALPRQYFCLKVTELISRSADSTDCIYIHRVTYTRISRPMYVYMFAHPHATTRA